MYGKMLNKMFGGGECASTALALMNMIPMPFQKSNEKKMEKDKHIKNFWKFLDPPEFEKTCKKEIQEKDDEC